jgi:putative DNA primase/helicase
MSYDNEREAACCEHAASPETQGPTITKALGKPHYAIEGENPTSAARNAAREKPFLALRADPLPPELKAFPQWVTWRGERRGGKWTKVPYAYDGNRASVKDASTWCSFDDAYYAYLGSDSLDGVGFVFTAEDDFVGIDLDHCVDERGEAEPKAAAIVKALASYAEYSASGAGLHVIARGELAKSVRATARSRIGIPIEIYPNGRYFTMTGVVYGKPTGVVGAQRVLDYLVANVTNATTPGERRGQSKSKRTSGPRYLSNDDLIARAMSARNGEKFRRLWSGDTSLHGGDDSRADAALLGMLLFWTRGDRERADFLFRQSGLYREEKWDRRPDYRKRTFDFVTREGAR